MGSAIYPKLPAKPIGSHGLPVAFEKLPENGKCPCCKQSWLYYAKYGGGRIDNTYPDGVVKHNFPMPDYPHLRYACGGIWAELDGFWEGRCRRKAKQLILPLEHGWGRLRKRAK